MVKASVIFDDNPPDEDILYLKPGENLYTGERYLQSSFGDPTSLEIDILNLASSVYACDIAFKRGKRENLIRHFELTIPVVNLAVFNEILGDLSYALYRLSHDAWNIRFIQRDGRTEATQAWPDNTPGKVLLFSGGLDSFAAAVKYGSEERNVSLVSHVTANQVVASSQKSLYEFLQKIFPKIFKRTEVRVNGRDRSAYGFPFPRDQEREETQRTRSFLFLSLAGLVARRRGIHDIVVIAENGQMAIHLPLSAARISAFSTHTAHPEFVHVMGKILSKLLNHSIQIENPFLYQTKAEVVETIAKEYQDALTQTVSCWKASRVSGGKNHYGFCIPCIVRRLSPLRRE